MTKGQVSVWKQMEYEWFFLPLPPQRGGYGTGSFQENVVESPLLIVHVKVCSYVIPRWRGLGGGFWFNVMVYIFPPLTHQRRGYTYGNSHQTLR